MFKFSEQHFGTTSNKFKDCDVEYDVVLDLIVSLKIHDTSRILVLG
jgi:hypothetical protein